MSNCDALTVLLMQMHLKVKNMKKTAAECSFFKKLLGSRL